MQLSEAKRNFLENYFVTHDRNSKTRAAYTADLEQFSDFMGSECQLRLVDEAAIESWAAHLKGKCYAPASLRRKVVVLKVFCSYWVRRGILKESPFWRVRLSFGEIEQLPRTLTENEIRALLLIPENSSPRACVGADYRHFRNVALVDLLFATGMRVGEASNLNLDDFVVDEALIKVHGKGRRERLAFLVDEVTKNIQERHRTARMRVKTEASALFLNAAGNRLSTQGIAQIIAKRCNQVGIGRKVTPHMFRHTAATFLLRNGADLRVVQEFLGHRSITTTQRYTHVAKNHLVAELEKHHPSFTFRRMA